MNTDTNITEQTAANNAITTSHELKKIIEQRIKKPLAKSEETTD